LDFSFNLRASLGNHIYNNFNATGAYYSLVQNLTVLSNLPTSVLDTNFIQAGGSSGTQSDIYIENASFLRMDNLSFGYNVGKVFNNKANLRFTANVQNVFVITKYKGLDPEMNGGIDNNFYPRPRTVVFGLNLDF
jgi:iron complex outermembrane receptor protein